jgi:hypothetical protein
MRGHRTLVFLDDFDEPEAWGIWCIDCDLSRFGFASDRQPGRIAKKHEKETRTLEVARAESHA